jgi:hypothetical protein
MRWMRQRGLRGLSLLARRLRAALERELSRPPAGGWFHLCRFAKEQGDFSHHYFPSLDDEAETFLLMRDLFDRVKQAERRLR